MSQHDYDIANGTGAAVRDDINNALEAIQTNNSGAEGDLPSTKAFMLFADTENNVMKIRNAANNDFIELFQLDGTFTLEDGTASTPALAFRDDLNTGIFSSAADTFNVATGGVERMKLGSTTVFNEDGADVDFRIEGDTEANLFYVDAGNGHIGINDSTPTVTLDITGEGGGNGEVHVKRTSGASCFIQAQTDFAVFGSNTEHKVQLKSNSTTALTINTTQLIGIGTTDPDARLHVNSGDVNTCATFESSNAGAVINVKDNNARSSIEQNGNDLKIISDTDAGSSGNSTIKLQVDASTKVTIDKDGNVVATGTITPNSDIAFKKDIEPLTNVLNKVTQLLGINFTYKSNNEKSMGLVAQDVEKVFPELVRGEEGNKSLNYMGLTGALIEAIKELSAKVEALEAA